MLPLLDAFGLLQDKFHWSGDVGFDIDVRDADVNDTVSAVFPEAPDADISTIVIVVGALHPWLSWVSGFSLSVCSHGLWSCWRGGVSGGVSASVVLVPQSWLYSGFITDQRGI